MTRLFHTLLPIPECDHGDTKNARQQMKLMGNMSLHEVWYECPLCFRRLGVVAAFTENPQQAEVSPAERAATDDTP